MIKKVYRFVSHVAGGSHRDYISETETLSTKQTVPPFTDVLVAVVVMVAHYNSLY